LILLDNKGLFHVLEYHSTYCKWAKALTFSIIWT